MKRIFLILIVLFITKFSFAGEIDQFFTYSTNSQVTATNLNGNFSNIITEVNGGLDNDNADTSNGYRFFEVKSSLPSAGQQGRIVFVTADNTINLDTGSTWSTFSSIPQGTIVMWSGLIANIPAGWEFADGSCSITCPDLRDRFIAGANSDSGGVAKTNITGSLTTSGGTYSATTGSTTLTAAQSGLPAHTHAISTRNSNGAGTFVQESADSGGSGGNPTTESTGGSAASSGHTHTVSIEPYYSLAFIIKT